MTERWSRPMRVAYIVNCLVGNPRRVFSLGGFAREMEVARSTVSEDVSVIKKVFRAARCGDVQTLPGATGGVRLNVRPSPDQIRCITETLITELSDPGRVLPGGFLYMTDIIFSPRWAEAIGAYFACHFEPLEPDGVATIETKGIPLAMMTARALNLPLVLIRRDGRVTEGSSVSINYVSGSSSRIQTMSLPRRAVDQSSSVIIIDDFMRGGGTAKGACDLLAEFEVEVLGVGVVAATGAPDRKLMKDYVSLVEVHFASDGARVDVHSTAPPLK